MKFDFVEDQSKKGDDKAAVEARQKRQTEYRDKYVQMVTAAWSKRYQVNNVREPQQIWGKLNPTQIQVNVFQVDNGQHFTINVHGATYDDEYVQGQQVRLSSKLDPQEQFNSATGYYSTSGQEIVRVKAIAPPIFFGEGASVIPADGITSLAFLATYLKRINNPHFTIDIQGYSRNTKLAKQRAEAVKTALVSGGLTNHTLTTSGTSQPGERKAILTPSIDANWKNVQDVTVHEFGHMIGLGDEYKSSDTKLASHHELTKKAFGEKYADQVAANRDNPTRSASIMFGGNDVRIQHYVTFWKALVETAKEKATAPDPKFDYDDWKFIG